MQTRYPGDRRVGTDHIDVTLTEDGKISGIAAYRNLPLWALASVTQTRTGMGTVLSSGLTAAAQEAWATRVDVASLAVKRSGVLAANSGWDGGLVVEVPDKDSDFAALSGRNASDTAAVATCKSGTSRIVISPSILTLSAGQMKATLIHEAVHAATESACSPSEAWVSEGAAESVATANDAQSAATNKELVRRYLKDNGVPDKLPKTVVSVTDYALAQVAVDQVRAHLGRAAAADFLARGFAGPLNVIEEADPQKWYLEELQRRAT